MRPSRSKIMYYTEIKRYVTGRDEWAKRVESMRSVAGVAPGGGRWVAVARRSTTSELE